MTGKTCVATRLFVTVYTGTVFFNLLILIFVCQVRVLYCISRGVTVS